MTTGLYVLHDIGDREGGAPWRDAASAVLPIEAPDLPGHGGSSMPIGGNYDVAGAAFFIAREVARTDRAGLGVAVGVGTSGWSAQLAALAGLATALVLVDGLGDPWLDPPQRARLRRLRFRAIADDPAALAPHERGGLDPRLAHGVDPHGSRELALEAAAATEVPTLICGTRPPDAEVVAAFPTATVAPVSSTHARDVVPEIAEWLGHRRVDALPPQRW